METQLFSPTTKIGSLESELKKIEADYRKYVSSGDFNQQEWLVYLSKTVISDTVRVRMPLSGNADCASYKWDEENGEISILMKLKKSEKLELTTKGINCSAISGDFWSEVEIVDLSRTENYAKVVIRPKEHFPVLIRCGLHIDPLSSYFLSILSILLQNEEFFIKWGTKAGVEGCCYAYYILGRHLIAEGKQDMAAYWLSKACLDSRDYTCLIALASLLSKETISKPYYEFAENILCDAVNHGDANAALDLGVLYLNGGGEVESDPVKGANLFNLNAVKSDLDAEAINIINKTENGLKKFPWVDIVISSGLIAAIGGATYAVYKWFIKQKSTKANK